MILVALGTQDKEFKRLLLEIDKQIEKGNLKGEVIVQSGCTKYTSKNMKIFDLIPMDEFDKLIKKCDLLITHGGVGIILNGLKYAKKIIAVPRLKKYQEHVNDHQLQIIDNFKEEGYLIGVHEVCELEEAISLLKDFKPKKFKSNQENMVNLVRELIEK